MLMAKELQSIQRIKNGCSRSDVGFLCKLCYYLEVDMGKLLEYKKQYHKNEYVTEFGTEYVWIKRFGALFIVPTMERLHIILRKFQNNGNFNPYNPPWWKMYRTINHTISCETYRLNDKAARNYTKCSYKSGGARRREK